MDQQLDAYRVHYYTNPSPGLPYYHGSVVVFAEDTDTARNMALRELACSRCRITKVEREEL